MTFDKNNLEVNNAVKKMLLIATMIFTVTFLQAQVQMDSAAIIKTCAAANKKTPVYFTKESNVVFPEILKGSEDETLDYIEKFSNRRREYLVRMYMKGKKFLPKAAAILNKYNLPEEFKVLMALESAYNANAVSRAGAVGYWQFMDDVAKEYGLKFAKHLTSAEIKKIKKERGRKAACQLSASAKLKDDRKNFNKATIAAARYLRDRRANLDDNWLLIAASYNCGVGNVWSAIEKTGKKNPSFWDIKKYLPAETKAYVMNFITLNVIFKNYENFAKNKLIFTPIKTVVAASEEEESSSIINESSASSQLK